MELCHLEKVATYYSKPLLCSYTGENNKVRFVCVYKQLGIRKFYINTKNSIFLI